MGHHSDQPFPEYGRRRQTWVFVHGLGHKVSRVPVDFSAAGEQGVREVIQNILAEFELTMALAGCATLEDVANAAREKVG